MLIKHITVFIKRGDMETPGSSDPNIRHLLENLETPFAQRKLQESLEQELIEADPAAFEEKLKNFQRLRKVIKKGDNLILQIITEDVYEKILRTMPGLAAQELEKFKEKKLKKMPPKELRDIGHLHFITRNEKKENLSSAHNLLIKALSRDPADFLTHYYAALVFIELRRYDLAKNYILTCLDKEPCSDRLIELMIDTLFKEGGMYIETAFELENNGEKHAAKEQKENAKKCFEKIIRNFDPNCENAMYGLAQLALSHEEDFEKAEEWFKEMLSLNDQSVDALNGLATMHILTTQNSIDQCGFNPETLFAKGKYMAGDLTRAENAILLEAESGYQYIQQSLNIDPKNSYAWSLLGTFYLLFGKDEKAFHCFVFASQLDPGNSISVQKLNEMAEKYPQKYMN